MLKILFITKGKNAGYMTYHKLNEKLHKTLIKNIVLNQPTKKVFYINQEGIILPKLLDTIVKYTPGTLQPPVDFFLIVLLSIIQ